MEGDAMTTTDIDALHATLDLDPSDQETRRVLADAYEDAGDWVMADGLRWMADGDRYADIVFGRHCWLSRHWWPGPESAHAAVDSSLYAGLRGQIHWPAASIGGRKGYPTRRAAEEALCRALAGPSWTLQRWLEQFDRHGMPRPGDGCR